MISAGVRNTWQFDPQASYSFVTRGVDEHGDGFHLEWSRLKPYKSKESVILTAHSALVRNPYATSVEIMLSAEDHDFSLGYVRRGDFIE